MTCDIMQNISINTFVEVNINSFLKIAFVSNAIWFYHLPRNPSISKFVGITGSLGEAHSMVNLEWLENGNSGLLIILPN